jgi:polynucleotide 5'-kinase involved in rRNA processing
MIIGGIDAGKTSAAIAIMSAAVAAGRRAGFVDADVGNPSVGPPTCAGLRLIRTRRDLETLENADGLHFVGGISPERLILQQVVATAALVDRARAESDLVVIDTPGLVGGVAAESLKYHEMELCRPDRVVALQRGAELEPMVGMLRRFFGVEIQTFEAAEGLPSSPDERAHRRAARLKEAFAPPLEVWRVKPTVFAPTLSSGVDLARLDRVLVGVHDEAGRCRGLGVLEFEEGVLRVRTNCGEGMQGLRLGSVRLDLDTFQTSQINLGEVMFGI